MARRIKKTRFGRYLDDLRITYYKAAKGCGTSTQNVRNWAMGKTRPRMDKYEALRLWMREKYQIVLSTYDFEVYDEL